MPDYDIEQSKTFKQFKSDLVKLIPRVPNDKASLQALESKSPTDLLIIYLCWKLRLVELRPRKVKGHHRLWSRPSFLRVQQGVTGLLRAVEAGHELTPYLSLKVRRDGFVLQELADSTGWEHKDFLLNVMGLHHFHLGTKFEQKGHINRTNEVLFAFVGHDTFEILGLFNHAVFEAEGDELTTERMRIWTTYDRFQSRRTPREGFYMGGYGGLGITTAGTPSVVTVEAIKHVEIIKRFDPCLESPQFVPWLWNNGDAPPKPKLRWHYEHLTLGLLDAASGTFFALR